MASGKYVWFGMKVTPQQKRRIERLAAERGVSQKEAVLQLVEAALDDDAETSEVQPGSFLDGVEDLVGTVAGPADLSTGKHHLEGYGR